MLARAGVHGTYCSSMRDDTLLLASNGCIGGYDEHTLSDTGLSNRRSAWCTPTLADSSAEIDAASCCSLSIPRDKCRFHSARMCRRVHRNHRQALSQGLRRSLWLVAVWGVSEALAAMSHS
jgi:hypothetical protein